jgi:hypothetical protein
LSEIKAEQKNINKLMDEYKSICDKCYRKTFYETEQPCGVGYPKKKTCKTCGHVDIPNPMSLETCTGTLRVINTSDLDDKLTRYYESKERVEIEYTDGEKERGTIGKTTGWKPIYILVKKINSRGGLPIMSSMIKNIKVV